MRSSLRLAAAAALIAACSAASATYSTVACVSNYYATNGCPGGSASWMLDQHGSVGGPSAAAASTGSQQFGNFGTSVQGFSGHTTSTGGWLSTGGSVDAGFNAGGSFDDIVSFSGAGLAPGTTIPLQITLELSGTFTGSGSGSTNGGSLPGGRASFGVYGMVWGLLSDSFSMSYGPNYAAHAVNLSKTIDLTVASGTRYSLSAGMDIGSSAFANWTSTADFTGHVRVTPMLAGVTVSSDSGFAYAMPAAAVPEPEPWALMLAGLGVIGQLTHRRMRAAL